MDGLTASQAAAIWWAQFRTTRNHLPRRSWASVLGTLVSIVWYGLAIAAGVSLAVILPTLSRPWLLRAVPMIVGGVFLFWQVGPLFTLSSGWSLQLNKLVIYPIRNSTLFAIEVLLRLTTAPEMIPLLLGLVIGLARHPGFSVWRPALLLLFIPFNLFLSLAVREFLLHSFERNRFRELFTVLIISIGLIPQLILRGNWGARVHPYFLAACNAPATPWGEAAHLGMGTAQPWEAAALLGWIGLTFVAARRLFRLALTAEETLRIAPVAAVTGAGHRLPRSTASYGVLDRLLPDPLAALLRKELQSLLRMPRFRVVFGTACVFSVLIFLPLSHEMSGGSAHPILSSNFLIVVTLYGLLILSDALLLNVFGMDRTATELYFTAPIPLRTVLLAKNLAAIVFVAVQSALVLMFAALIRTPASVADVMKAISSSAVISIFFLAVGNLCSISAARPVNPAQTFRRQAGGKIQLWLLLCAIGMLILVGSAELAQWAIGAPWAAFGVFAVEFAIGLIFYFVALDSAVERAGREREELMAALSKNASPIGLGS